MGLFNVSPRGDKLFNEAQNVLFAIVPRNLQYFASGLRKGSFMVKNSLNLQYRTLIKFL